MNGAFIFLMYFKAGKAALTDAIWQVKKCDSGAPERFWVASLLKRLPSQDVASSMDSCLKSTH